MPYIRHLDWLGSARLSTTWSHTVQSKVAYAPFGETYNEAGAASNDRSFTGQEQDTVSGNAATGIYDFLFRKYDPAAGRWLSPDPAGWDATDPNTPQSINRYAYLMNNPLNLIDLNGLWPIPCPQDTQTSVGGEGAGSGATFQINACDNGFIDTCGTDPSFCNGNYQYQLVTYYTGTTYEVGLTFGPPAPPPGPPSILSCAWQSVKSNWAQTGLDALGAIPLESTALKGFQIAGGVVAGSISAYRNDKFGVGLSGVGVVLSVLNAEKASIAKNIAEAVPVAGTVVAVGAVGYDIFGSDAYKSCRNGAN